ncbi:M3 family metallopeptidase [Frigoribacterium faeni]|uniref:Peptidyl-dipeptidase Dcp n=1 Tax=Frigoribacterium faeni TaxID=145483 RepID=A0A7W3JIE0_9MICO|nr:M3 family metallopeptidase [Frigoribacterium faeni]MBA8813334.1 peptidyl-dipeptidase Dcp [Frigoribacterium faeni]GEK84362.1 peptidyl-dipeptidase Dcp [Frigoribacterium faeni]
MTNPFSAPSTLPYSLPPFASITDDDYLPAFEAGFAEQLAEIEAIATDGAEPTFENTVAALERSGATLTRVEHVFFIKTSADSNAATDALELDLAPRLAAHADAIHLDPRLFARLTSIHDRRDDLGLTDEQRYLVERLVDEAARSGAALGDDDKDRLRDLNGRLSTLTTRFEKNLLADTNDLAVVVDDVAELDGLDAGAIAAAAEAARDRGLEGRYVITLVLFSGHPYLAGLTNESLRQRIMQASLSRGRRGGDHDNRELVLEIVRLRAERAELLGFRSHAAYVTAGETAGTAEAVADLLGRLAPPAARNALAEQADLERIAGRPVTAADWAFYAERVRTEKHDVDTAAMRPYFEAERVLRDGVFFAAGLLYGLRFAERPDLVAYHPEARVFEVTDADGAEVGLYVLDLHTRDSKRGGAWMNPLVSQSALTGLPTVVVNNLNVPKPPAGRPTLLTLDEVTTFFHEFGHALHGLVARVTYPTFSGTNVFRDFVEFPSQVNEMWMLWPEVLEHYAVHHETGERLPQHLVDALIASQGFNQGFETSEYLAAALLDQAWHALSAAEAAAVTDVEAFEEEALAAVGLDLAAVPTRYSSTYFAHTFSGGYDAGYYSYIWSEVLDADTVEWFEQNGGPTRENGDRFRSRLLGVGGSKDPLAAYRDFRGRDARVEPLLARRGLA